MLLSYLEKKYLLVSIIVIVLDGIITYLIPGYVNNLNYFYPMLTISLLPYAYLCNPKQSYILIIFMGILYDLLYSNIIFYNAVLFVILIIIDKKIAKYFNNSLFLFITLVLINIVIYDTTGFILILLTNYQSLTLNDLFYKINHSILLNILSAFVFWFMFKKRYHHA